MIVEVAGKGLVVVSGCSHAGAVNVLRNAKRLTGRDRIAGFAGGFHLTGAVFEPAAGLRRNGSHQMAAAPYLVAARLIRPWGMRTGGGAG